MSALRLAARNGLAVRSAGSTRSQPVSSLRADLADALQRIERAVLDGRLSDGFLGIFVEQTRRSINLALHAAEGTPLETTEHEPCGIRVLAKPPPKITRHWSWPAEGGWSWR